MKTNEEFKHEKQLSQADAILDYLLEGRTITALTAFRLFECFRLGARIHDLKRLGYEIESKRVKVNSKYVAEYKLIKSGL